MFIRYKIVVIIVLIVFPSFVFAQGNYKCSSNGYTIATINGIFTDNDGAKKNLASLRTTFGFSFKNQNIDYQYLLNQTHLAGAGDLIDVIQQGFFEQKSDYDLVEMLNDASQKVTTQKLLLVAHSQGNFYANNFYDKTASQEGGVPSQSIGVYSVATPANSVGGGGKYLTSDTDNVIASTVARFINILSPNVHISLQSSDGNGHSFSDVYLKYKGDRIVSDIKSSLNKLEVNDEQEPRDPCISPPELTTTHKVQGVILAVADPTANIVKGGFIVTYNTGVYIADGAQNIGMAIGNEIHNTGVVIGSMFKGLLANTIGSSPDVNSVATALPDNSEPAEDSSSLSPDKTTTKTKSTNETTAVVVSANVSQSFAPKTVLHYSGGGSHVSTSQLETDPLPEENSNSEENSSAPVDETPPVPPVIPPVVDTTSPVISIIGAGIVNVIKNTTYTDAGATALDNIDGDITAKIVTVNPVDVNTIADYTITYNVKDAAGNPATQITRLVHVVAPPPPPLTPDTTAPIITVTGANPVTVDVGVSYNDAGATALDNIDGSVTVSSSGMVNTNVVGTYTITYGATDAAGNTAVPATRIVNVVIPTPSVSNVLYSQPDSSTEINSMSISSFDTFTGKSGHIQSIKFAYNDYGNSIGHFIGVSVVDRTDGINYYGAEEGGRCGDTYESTGANTKVIVELDSSTHYKEYPCTGPDLVLNPTHNYGVALFRNHGGADTQKFYGNSNSNNSAYLNITDDSIPSTGKAIKKFNFPSLGSVGIIDEDNHSVEITVPFGTDITALTPTVKISGGASISPDTSVLLDFTDPVIYTITAENGLAEDYTVTVLVHSSVIYSQPDNSVEITGESNVGLPPQLFSALGNISNLKFSYNDHGNSTGHFIGVQIIDQDTSRSYYATKIGMSCGSAYESTGVNAPIIVTLDETFKYKEYPCTGSNLIFNPTHGYKVVLFHNSGGSDTQRFYGSSNVGSNAYFSIESNGVVSGIPDEDLTPPANTATKLKIITSPQTIAVNTASSVVEVESQDESGTLAKVVSTTYINLSSSSITGLFASSPASGPCDNDHGGWEQTKQIYIAATTAHKSFCYKDSAPGTPTITVSAAGLSSDSQTFTISL